MTKIFNRSNLKHKRKFLRNNMTSAEVILWSRLKNSQLGGMKFRRQESVNQYIIDFYCPSRKLAIEVDGDVHGYGTRVFSDMKRQKEIEKLGIKVLRYTNTDVKENLDHVLQDISQEAAEALSEPPLSPLLGKEGKKWESQM